MATQTMPPARATQGIVMATVAAYLLLWAYGQHAQDVYAMMAGIVPARISGNVIVPDGFPVLLTPISATLMHGSIAHLGFNMVMLYYVGRFVELALGTSRYVLLYIVGAYVSAFAEFIAHPASQVPVIGASGAISALLGAYAIYFGERRAARGRWLSAEAINMIWLAVSWLGLQLLMGWVMNGPDGGIAIWAHVGGFIAGLILAKPLLLTRH